MNIFYWLYERGRRLVTWPLNKISIATPTLITPERIYQDLKYVLKAYDLCDWKGTVFYLRDDVRAKLREKSVSDGWGFSVTYRIEIGGVNYGSSDNLIFYELMSYEVFLRHEQLSHLIAYVMMAPFHVMLADLDKTKKFESWYQNFIDRIGRERQEALALQKRNLTDNQKARVAGVLKRLELFEAELEKAAEYLRQYCRDSIAYIESMRSVIAGMVNEKRVQLLEKNAHLLAQEATKAVEEKYDTLQQHALAVNASLEVFGMSADVQLGELTPAALEKLERGSAQLKSNLDEIHKVYFGNAIVEHKEEELVKVTT